MFKNILFFSIILLFSACSVKEPITWENRIVKQRNIKYPDLSYSEFGNPKNKTLLFLHGFGESSKTWRFIVPELSKYYHLVLVDLKGFGDSPKIKDEAYSVYDQANSVAHFIEKHDFQNLTIVGRSFGGGVALVLSLMQEDALMQERIKRLILINSMVYKQNLPSMMKLLNEPVIGYLGIHLMSNEWMAQEAYEYAFYNDTLIPDESVKYSSQYLSVPLAKYVYLKTVEQIIPDDILKIQKRYRTIKTPTLLLWGKEDVSIRVSTAYRLHKNLQKSTLRVLPKVGHMPNEESPSKVVSEILKFMEVSQ